MAALSSPSRRRTCLNRQPFKLSRPPGARASREINWAIGGVVQSFALELPIHQMDEGKVGVCPSTTQQPLTSVSILSHDALCRTSTEPQAFSELGPETRCTRHFIEEHRPRNKDIKRYDFWFCWWQVYTFGRFVDGCSGRNIHTGHRCSCRNSLTPPSIIRMGGICCSSLQTSTDHDGCLC